MFVLTLGFFDNFMKTFSFMKVSVSMYQKDRNNELMTNLIF